MWFKKDLRIDMLCSRVEDLEHKIKILTETPEQYVECETCGVVTNKNYYVDFFSFVKVFLIGSSGGFGQKRKFYCKKCKPKYDKVKLLNDDSEKYFKDVKELLIETDKNGKEIKVEVKK